MARPHSIKNHPQVHRINSMLADGVPHAEIAREMSIPRSTLSRYSLLIKSEMAKVVDDEPGVTAILGRLVEAADHAQLVRRQAKVSGSPVAQTRAIKTEAELLTKLLTELGVDDIRIAEFLDEAQGLAIALREYVRANPDAASTLIRLLESTPQTAELANALKNQIGSGK